MIDQTTARLMRTVAPPPADTLLRPRDDAPSSLPFTPCCLLIRLLAHAPPDGTRIQVGARLCDVLGERGANGRLDAT